MYTGAAAPTFFSRRSGAYSLLQAWRRKLISTVGAVAPMVSTERGTNYMYATLPSPGKNRTVSGRWRSVTTPRMIR